MSPSPSAPPIKGALYTDMELWKRPFHLFLPPLEYESDVEVWQWRVKLVLKHNSLWELVLSSAPRQTAEQAATARHCAALLASCISETILADLLTLFPNNEDLEIPHILFERAKRTVQAVQMVRKDSSAMLRDLLSKTTLPVTLKTLLNALDPPPGESDTPNRWLNIIWVTSLLVKRYKLTNQTSAADYFIENAHNGDCQRTEKNFKELRGALMVAEGQR